MIVTEQSGNTPRIARRDKFESSDSDQASSRVRLALAMRVQRAEIIKHREAMVIRLGRIVCLDEAARDWIPAHAAEWRDHILSNPDDA